MTNTVPELRIHVLRLNPGADLRAEMEAEYARLQPVDAVDLVNATRAACVISAVGSLSKAVLRYAAEPHGSVIEAPLELVTLSGTLGTGGVHLHASVADAKGRMRAGHVMPGCIVRTTAEIVMALLPGWTFTREMDAATGFRELVARRLT